jgi:hypothetical protein
MELISIPPGLTAERRLIRFHRKYRHLRQRTGRGQKAITFLMVCTSSMPGPRSRPEATRHGLLLLRHWRFSRGFPSKLLLQGLFSGGIDSFADHKKRFRGYELQKPRAN